LRSRAHVLILPALTRVAFVTFLLVAGPGVAGVRAAQSVQTSADAAAAVTARSADLPFAFDGPPAPVAPEVINRDEVGRATVRAIPLTEPLRLDGTLDETIYETSRPFSDLIQLEPHAGQPATQKTEGWVTFDREHIYVSARCWESNPEKMIANELRRDGSNLYQNEYVDIILDTFYDRRNAMLFTVTPLGARGDGQITNERVFNRDLNPVWDVKVGRFDGGWTFEAAIPFKSLRYRPGRAQIWGFQFERYNRWKNEIAFLTPIPAAFGWTRAFMQISFASTLVGLQVPPGSKNIDIKPYAVSHLTSDALASPRLSNDLGGDVGVDLRYGVTQNLTADLTYNTDFAQVEADDQQVNLTRFSLFFPEKREFFLENQGMFAFGGATSTGAQGNSDTPVLFYSRRIGLNAGRVIPIVGGGRLTGQVGRFNVGVLNMQAGDEPLSGTKATNFGVLRLRRNVLRKSAIGVMYTGRTVGQSGGPRNDAYGVDGVFGFFDNLTINSYWARTVTAGKDRGDTSYRTQIDYAGDRYGVQAERLFVGNNFNPELGFIRRGNLLRNFGQLRFSPRPKQSKRIRKFGWIGSVGYIENGGGTLETRDADAEFNVEFQNSDKLIIGYSDNYEFLERPFEISSGITLPAGGYRFGSAKAAFNFGKQRRLSANTSVEYGSFYNGHKTTAGIGGGRVNVTHQFSLEPTVSVNRVDLVQGAFVTALVGSRVTYAMTPRMFASALLQYNSSARTMASNIRLRWEYLPGSELFVVYNEQRDTLVPAFPELSNRSVIVKINRLFRF
jgi:hypothetical protein